MSASAVANLRELAEGMDVTEILSAIDVHNHCGLDLGRIGIIPKKKFLSIASKGDFYQMSHFLNLFELDQRR
jgi:hypothetical protein